MNGLENTNYAKLDWRNRQHHARYLKFINGMERKLVCQDCYGRGGRVELIDMILGGPWESCGWCEGTGYVTPFLRGLWLRYQKQCPR